nr:MAG TPA: hypothetical protein [Caudoviricetes sp.]
MFSDFRVVIPVQPVWIFPGRFFYCQNKRLTVLVWDNGNSSCSIK